MNSRLVSILAGAGLALAVGGSALAAGDRLPGDIGKPGDQGVMPTTTGPRPPARVLPPAPSVAVALKAAQAIAAGCKQYPLGIAVVNSVGGPILTYIPDGSQPLHSYMAIRKAYSALTFKANSSTMVAKAQQDPAVAAQVKADPNLVGYSGGILLKSGDKIIGAIGVSGAEPGGHDEECGMIGLAAIQGDLQ